MPADGTGPYVARGGRHTDEYFATHLGASEWAAALGLDPFKTPIELYEEKVGLRARGPMTNASWLGLDLEAGVLRFAKRELGVSGAPCGPDPANPMTLECPGARHLCVTPDNLLADGDLLQGKTTALTAPVPRWVLDEKWGEGGDLVPEHVLVQCVGELHVARLALADEETRTLAARGLLTTPTRIPERDRVAALVPGRPEGVCLYVIEWADVAALAATWLPAIEAFWRCVVSRTPPPPDGTVAYAQHLARRHKVVRAEWIDGDDLDTAHLAAQLREAEEERDRWEARRAKAANLMRDRIGDAGGVRASWGEIPYRQKRGERTTDLAVFAHDLYMFAVEHGKTATAALRAFESMERDHVRVDRVAFVDNLIALVRKETGATLKEIEAIREAASTRADPTRSFGPCDWND